MFFGLLGDVSAYPADEVLLWELWRVRAVGCVVGEEDLDSILLADCFCFAVGEFFLGPPRFPGCSVSFVDADCSPYGTEADSVDVESVSARVGVYPVGDVDEAVAINALAFDPVVVFMVSGDDEDVDIGFFSPVVNGIEGRGDATHKAEISEVYQRPNIALLIEVIDASLCPFGVAVPVAGECNRC